MANDVKLQEGHPVDENLRPLKVGGQSTSLELSKEKARIKNLHVTGTLNTSTGTIQAGVVAGEIIGYTRIANDQTGSSDAYIEMDATLTVLQTVTGTNLSIAFVVPPSGNVEITMDCQVYASSRTVEFALSDNATYNEIDETHTYDLGVQSSDETDVNMVTVRWVVTGLTAGESLTYYIASAETSSGSVTIRHGRFRTTGLHYPPIIIKAVVLPATITTGE